MKHIITVKDLENIVGFNIPSHVAKRITEYDLCYESIDNQEFLQYVNSVINVLFGDIKKSGPHRHVDWQTGWLENFEAYRINKNLDSLIPKYYGKSKYVRWNKQIVRPITHNFDYKIQTCILDTIIHNYLAEGFENVYEFGCGPAIHLLRLQELNTNMRFYGLDWAESSQSLICEINKNLSQKIIPINYDFFRPNFDIEIEKNSLIYTITALEQTSTKYGDFIDYIIAQKPRLCINFEPIMEFLDANNLIDNLSIKYCEKRNYLSGFYNYLLNLQEQKKITIIDTKRFYSGTEYLEGYSLIVWKPL